MVKSVDNGLAAFADLQEGRYAVILLDILMPFLEGKNFFRQLESDFPEMTKRVVFVTGMAGDDETRRSGPTRERGSEDDGGVGCRVFACERLDTCGCLVSTYTLHPLRAAGQKMTFKPCSCCGCSNASSKP